MAAPCRHMRTAIPALGSPWHMFAPQLLCFIWKATRDGIASHRDCTGSESPTDTAISREAIFHCVAGRRLWKRLLTCPLPPKSSRSVVIFLGYSGESKHDRGAKKCYGRSSSLQVTAFSCCFTAGYFLTAFLKLA